MSKQTTVLGETFFALCKRQDTPISLSLWLRFKYSHSELLKFELPIGDYLEKDARIFAGDYACASFLKKFKGLNTGIDLEAAAIQSFTISEETCRQTNRRIRYMRHSVLNTDLASSFMRAKRKISHILGSFDVLKVSPFFGWGPGATSTIPRRKAFVDTKMVTHPFAVSRGARDLFLDTISEDLHWSYSLLGQFPSGAYRLLPSSVSLEESCKVVTVPKSAKTDRTIAIEPTGNLFLQKGVGGYIRRRLKRWGIDLDKQEDNQNLAKNALSLGLSTIDLASASDTLATELVYELLPVDWAIFLDRIRSKSYGFGKEDATRLEKFSSMGNGFTFELESLIFYALSSAIVDEHQDGVVSVYGDDIIVSRACARPVIELLRFCGFATNVEKSFIEGLFFESCGSHYFNGVLVTPPYQKEVLDNAFEIIRCHNRLYRWSMRVYDEAFAPTRLRLSTEVQAIIPYGDDGDDGFIVDTDEFFRYAIGRRDPSLGVYASVVAPRTKTFPGLESALLALFLRKIGEVSDEAFLKVNDGMPSYGNLESPETETNRFKRGYLFTRRWIYPSGVCFLS